jgi:hypothetical protein
MGMAIIIKLKNKCRMQVGDKHILPLSAPHSKTKDHNLMRKGKMDNIAKRMNYLFLKVRIL